MCSLLAQNTYYAFSIAVIFHNLDLNKRVKFVWIIINNAQEHPTPIFFTNQDCNILEMNSNIFDTGTISILIIDNKQGNTHHLKMDYYVA